MPEGEQDPGSHRPERQIIRDPAQFRVLYKQLRLERFTYETHVADQVRASGRKSTNLGDYQPPMHRPWQIQENLSDYIVTRLDMMVEKEGREDKSEHLDPSVRITGQEELSFRLMELHGEMLGWDPAAQEDFDAVLTAYRVLLLTNTTNPNVQEGLAYDLRTQQEIWRDEGRSPVDIVELNDRQATLLATLTQRVRLPYDRERRRFSLAVGQEFLP